MYAPHNMHFCNRFAIITPDHIQHLLHAQFPAFVAMSIKSAVRAKIATEYADIRRLYVKVSIEEYFITMQILLDFIGQAANEAEAGFFEKEQTFILSYSYT